MRKGILCVLCGILLLGITGCGNADDSQENKLKPNDFSGIWETDSGNNKYHLDCTGKYKGTTYVQSSKYSEKKTYVDYGTYEINGDSITLINEKGRRTDYHFFKNSNGEIDKNTICSDNQCFDKSSSSTCEKLSEITKEN